MAFTVQRERRNHDFAAAGRRARSMLEQDKKTLEAEEQRAKEYAKKAAANYNIAKTSGGKSYGAEQTEKKAAEAAYKGKVVTLDEMPADVASAFRGEKIDLSGAKQLQPEKSTVSKVLSDPMYYAEKVMSKPLDVVQSGVKDLLGGTKKQEERLAANQQMQAAETPSKGKLAEGILVKGADFAASSVTSTLDWLLGNAMKEIGWENNPISKLNEFTQKNKEANAEYYAKNLEKGTDAQKKIDEYGTMTAAAIPQAVIAMMSAGASAGAHGAGILAKGGTQLAGAEAAAAGLAGASAAAKAGQTVKNVATAMSKDPNYWTAFASVAGDSYQQAKEDGASDWEANMYALANGLLNAAAEVGGGIQTLPVELQAGKRGVRAWIRSMADEGKEEAVQGVIERALQNLTYGKGNSLLSTMDENAVLNPVTAAKEFAGGAVVGGVLGGGQMLAGAAINRRALPGDPTRQLTAAPKTGAENSKPSTEVVTETGQTVTQMSAVAEAFRAKGDDAATAVRKAQVLERMMAGEAVSNKQLDALGLREQSTQAVLTELTGVEVPKGATNSELRKIFRAAVEAASDNKEGTQSFKTEATNDVESGYRDSAPSNTNVADAQNSNSKNAAWRGAGYINEIAARIGGTPTWSDVVSASEYLGKPEILEDVKAAVREGYLRTGENGELALTERAKVAEHYDFNPENVPMAETEGERSDYEGLPQGTGAASRGFAGNTSDTLSERYMDAVDTYGAMPERENLPRQMPVPRSMDGETVVPRTVQSALGAEATSAETVGEITDEIARGGLSRAVITDTSALARAEQTIQDKGWETALVDWTADVRSGKVSKDLATLGIALYNKAVNSGNAKAAVNILTDLVDHARSGAQATQAMGILNRLTPEGKLYSIQRSVENLKSDLLERMGDLAPDVQLDDALVQEYIDAETEDARAAALDAIYQSIADQVPSTWRDKLNAWRYLSMLGNPRTHVRNIAGNLFFAPFRGVKNAIGAGIEHAVIGNQKGRTKSLVMPGFLKSEADRARYAAAQNEFGEVVDLIQSGGKFKNEFGEIRDRQQIFKSKVLEWARSKNSELMDTEDVWFSKQAYAASLTQYLKANGISAEQYNAPGFDKSLARAYAIKEAQKATYRDFNRFSDFVSGLGKTKSTVANTFIEAVLPYKRTPANIFVRGIEYSPIGLAKSLTYDLAQVRRGKLTAAEAIDNIASGLTGTGLTALGVLLANLGVVTGGGSGSDKEDAFSDLTGHQSYALEVGGKSVTLDWLAPEALPFFVGVELQKTLSNGIQSGDDIFTPLKKITEPMLEMSMLSGINDILDSVSDSDNKTWALLSSAATSYIGQYVPTLFGQIERTFENTRQSTYVDKESALPSDMQRAFAKAMNKLPGEYEQIGYIDEWGRTQSTGNLLQRAFNNFVNPAYVSSVNETAVDKELQRLVQQLGDKTVLPETAQKTLTIDGETKALTSGQYTKYATVIGQTRYQLLETAMDSAAYQSMSDTERAEYVSRVYQYAAATAKQNVFPAADVDAWVTNAKNARRDIGVTTSEYLALMQQYGSKFLTGSAYEKTKAAVQNTGISAEEYIRLRSGYDQNGDETISKAEVMSALDSTGLSREQKRELFSLYNKTWKNPYG